MDFAGEEMNYSTSDTVQGRFARASALLTGELSSVVSFHSPPILLLVCLCCLYFASRRYGIFRLEIKLYVVTVVYLVNNYDLDLTFFNPQFDHLAI